MAGSLTINGSVTSLQSGAKVIGPLTISATGTIGQTNDVTLTSGDNTVAIPATATACVIVPSTANTAVLKVRTVNGDTGITVSKTLPCVLSFDTSPPATLYINAAAGSAVVEVSFI